MTSLSGALIGVLERQLKFIYPLPKYCIFSWQKTGLHDLIGLAHFRQFPIYLVMAPLLLTTKTTLVICYAISNMNYKYNKTLPVPLSKIDHAASLIQEAKSANFFWAGMEDRFCPCLVAVFGIGEREGDCSLGFSSCSFSFDHAVENDIKINKEEERTVSFQEKRKEL